MTITQFPTVVWKTTWTDQGSVPSSAGQIYVSTSYNSNVRAGEAAAWTTISSILIYETDGTGTGLNIANLIAELSTVSYIRVSHDASNYGSI